MPVCCHPTCYTIVPETIICCAAHYGPLSKEARDKLWAIRKDQLAGTITRDEELDRQEAVVQEYYRRAAS